MPMPKTKNALIRQKVIDKCLSSGKNYSIRDMMNACNRELEAIGEYPVTAMNTIRDDINQISSNYPNAVIVSRRVGRNVYYSYENQNYSIYKIPLKDEDFAQLTQTLSILSKFEGMPQFEWIEELKMALNVHTDWNPIVGFDENIDLKGRDFFAVLFAAINNKQVLSITYRNFRRDKNQHFIVHPYFLKQYNGRWFIIGLSENIGKLSVFAFDRIVKIEEEHKDYIANTQYDFNEYFDDMIGVSKSNDAEMEFVELWVSRARWPYVETKPLHGSQRVISQDDTGVIIQLYIYLNRELEQLILSFGDDIKVLSPQCLKDTVYEKIIKSCKNYE